MHSMKRTTLTVGVALSLALTLLAAASIAPVGAQGAEPPLLRQFCEKGSAGGECNQPRGIAIDPASGDVYVADQSNNRIQRFSAWGQFLRAWGWGVVDSGPGNKPPVNEIQQVTIDATGGSFKLRPDPVVQEADNTVSIAFDASAATVQAALEGLSAFNPGDVAVSGPSGGPWAIEFVGGKADTDIPQLALVNSTLTGPGAFSVTTTQGGGSFEICVPAAGDVCRAAPKSSSQGGLDAPQGLAVDSTGNVYVVDVNNRRVQKFDPSGNPLLSFGGDVNRTKADEGAPVVERNLCPVAPGDVCQAGTKGVGAGQFGAWAIGSFIAIPPGAPETIHVGDQNRIQRFDTEGKYLSDLPDPEGLLTGKTVQALAADPSTGSLYAGFGAGVEDMVKLDPATGKRECTLTVARPGAVAVDGIGQVHVVSAQKLGTPPISMKIVQFNSGCKETTRFDAEEVGFKDSTGIATSSACGIDGVDLLVANSAGGPSFIRLYGPPPDPDVCPPPSVPPTIKAQHAFSVATTDAVVRAQINPHFWPDTTYWVQYGTEDCAAAPSACEGKALFPGAPLGAGVVDAFRNAGVTLTGLQPDTDYHYRFVAESEDSGAGPAFGEGEAQAGGSFHTYPLPSDSPPCPNDALRTGPAAFLPECRAYELVSPLEKNNGDIATGENSFSLSSTDGERATYSSFTSFGDPQGAPLTSQYLSSRDPESGWSTKAISPPRSSVPFYGAAAPANTPQFRAFSEDLCSGWVIQDSPIAYAEGAPAGVPNLYRQVHCGTCPFAGQLVAGSCHELLTTVPPPGFSREAEASESRYVPAPQGFSATGTRSLLRADAVLTEDACQTNPQKSKGLFQLYLAHEGALRLVSVLPNGKAACVHSSAGTAQGSAGGVNADNVHRAVSADASRIFWSASATAKNKAPVEEEGGAGNQPGPLYVRVNPEGPEGASSKCSEAEAGEACTAQITSDANARFWGADTQGATAIYTTGLLTSSELFEYDVEGEASTLIAKGVRGVAGISDDASRVYFVSGEALSGEPNGEGEVPAVGQPNLYLRERDSAGLDFIDTLSSLDVGKEVISSAPSAPVTPLPSKRTSRLSPDGMHLAFTSTAPLTGFDNTDANSGEPDVEVFLYDAPTGAGAGELHCVSCNPSGARPAGQKIYEGGNGEVDRWAAAQLPDWEHELHPSRSLSESGDRLFFESFDALVLRDTNGKQDVYEWQRASSKEQCAKGGAELYAPESDGCISLISSGQSSVDVEFLDASASGSDVFFTTTSSLLAHDYGLVDVYDARVGGGFAPPPTPDPICEGEACQGTPSPPDDPTPASSSFEGAGNLAEQGPRPRCPKGKTGCRPRCAKGKVRRKGRCISRKQAKRQKRANANRGRAKR